MAKRSRKYFTLVTRKDGVWSPQFGDYDRETVVQEIQDSYSEFRNVDRKVISTADDQAAINAAVANMQEG